MVQFIPLYIEGLVKIIGNFWLVAIYFIAAVIYLWRWEQNEKKRLKEAAKRLEARRAYDSKHSA